MPPTTLPKIPDGMVNLMKDFAKNVLKEQPENIYVFAAEYFENLICERDGSLDKGYETFRQYEEDLKRRKNEMIGFSSDNLNSATSGPSALDAVGMEVHGVAIKAKERESKLARLPMNRRKRLDNMKSGSQDSAIEEEEGTSSMPRAKRDTIVEQKEQQETTKMDVKNVSLQKPRILSSNKSTHNLNAIEEETVVTQKLNDLEQSDTPTNDTSLSDALTEPTIIEFDPIEKVNDLSVEGSETHVAAESDNDDTVQKTIATEETIETKDVARLNAKPSTDRSRTPESDSGLSEKSFNLKVHENEDIAVDEDNTIGDSESLIFSADINMNKEIDQHIETPKNDGNMNGDESESVVVSAETVPDADAEQLDVAETAAIEKCEEKNSIDAEIETEAKMSSDATKKDNEKTFVSVNVDSENPKNASSSHADATIENTGIEKIDNESADVLLANCGEDATDDLQSPANVDGVNKNEGTVSVNEEESIEQWQSAMDKLSEKVDELDTNQKKIVREIRDESENETEKTLIVERPSSFETQDENGKKSKSGDNVGSELRPEEYIATQLPDSAEKTVERIDENEAEQKRVNDNIRAADDVIITADDVETPIGSKSALQVDETAENTVDSHASEEEEAGNANERENVRNEESGQSKIFVVSDVIEDENPKENEPETKDISTAETADQVTAETATKNELQAVLPPNDSQESIVVLDQTASINELKIEKLKDATKFDPFAVTETNEKFTNEIKETSIKVMGANHKITAEADELKPADSRETDKKFVRAGKSESADEISNIAKVDVKDDDEKIEPNSIDDSVANAQETYSTLDSGLKLLESKEKEEKVEKNSKVVNESGTTEEKHVSECVSEEITQPAQDNVQMSENSKQIDGNDEALESKTETKETVLNMGLGNDQKSSESNKLESSLFPESMITTDGDANLDEDASAIETKAVGEIEISLKNVDSVGDNNLKTTTKAEFEDQIIESKIEDDAKAVIETADTSDEKYVETIMTEIQKDEKHLNETPSPITSSNLPTDEIVTTELKSDEMKEIDYNAIDEPPLNTESENVESTKSKAINVRSQDTTDEIDAAQTNNEEVENYVGSPISADSEKKVFPDEAQIIPESSRTVEIAEQHNEDVIINPIIAAMRNTEQFLNEIHSSRSESKAKLSNDEEGSAIQTEMDGEEMSEFSASNTNESFEHAETVIMGDESVKDLDILVHDGAEKATIDSQNGDADATKETGNDQIEPDSLDIFVDSLDVSLEPSMEPDSLVDSKSIDSLEAKETTTVVIVDNETKADLAVSIDDAMLSLNLSSMEDKDNPSKEPIEKTLLQAPLTSSRPCNLTIGQPIMGDVVNDKNNYRNLNEQMKNQLAALNNVGPSIPIQIFNIEEVESPLTPKPLQMTFELPQTTNKIVSFDKDDATIEQMVKEAAAELIPLKSAESVRQDESRSEIISNKAGDETEAIDADTDAAKPSFSVSHDVASSDISDTDTEKEKVTRKFCESGVDESSRDERDEASEIENFDLSSCGEDSLEAMYYQIRKSEIMIDKSKPKMPDTNIGDDKIAFPGKATDDLEQAFREVSGKKSLQSMESSADEVILHQLSTDTDGIMRLISGAENDSETETSASEHQAATTGGEEFTNPIMVAMQRNEKLLMDMHSVAASYQDENDLFPSGYSIDIDDMNVGNIRRKIMASSMSEADSDYEHEPSVAQTHRLTKDDFNISTAFEHMIRSDSTNDSESTIESAATKIQAGARGFLTRRRLRRSSAGTSTSVEKHSSIGNAAIDKSLDDLVQNSTHELLEHRRLESEETVDNSSGENKLIFGITDVKMEQKKSHLNDDAIIANIIISESHPEHTENESDEEETQNETAQRRLTLQRGDAMHQYSTPDESSDNNRNVTPTDQTTPVLIETSEPTIVGEEEIQKCSPSNGMNLEITIYR